MFPVALADMRWRWANVSDEESQIWAHYWKFSRNARNSAQGPRLLTINNYKSKLFKGYVSQLNMKYEQKIYVHYDEVKIKIRCAADHTQSRNVQLIADWCVFCWIDSCSCIWEWFSYSWWTDRQSIKSKLRTTGPFVMGTLWFLTQRARNAENISAWWRPHTTIQGNDTNEYLCRVTDYIFDLSRSYSLKPGLSCIWEVLSSRIQTNMVNSARQHFSGTGIFGENEIEVLLSICN